MKNLVVDLPNDILFWLLTGLGVTVSPHEFLGGLCLACAVASFFNRTRQADRRIWFSLGAAVIAAILVSIAWASLGFEWPPQLAMAAAGVVGRPAAELMISFQDRVRANSDGIADGVVDRIAHQVSGKERKGGDNV